jgi:hypothetical protein
MAMLRKTMKLPSNPQVTPTTEAATSARQAQGS